MLELVIFLSTLPIVWTGTVPTSYACLNSHATIQFDKYKDANSTVKYWKKENNGSKVILASIFLGRKDYYETYLGNISVDENKNLRIDNVSYNNEGTYEREIINLDGGTLKQSVFLNVLEPPSGLPKINKEKDDSGNMIVSCINSSPHERPEAAVVLKNNAGNMQSQFKYAVNEIVLKCCIEGESVSRCYPKHLSRCSYHILSRTNERFSSGTEDRETNIKESHCRVCIGVHLGSFAVCFAIFSVYVFFTKPDYISTLLDDKTKTF